MAEEIKISVATIDILLCDSILRTEYAYCLCNSQDVSNELLPSRSACHLPQWWRLGDAAGVSVGFAENGIKVIPRPVETSREMLQQKCSCFFYYADNTNFPVFGLCCTKF